jgi:hypothetical protein
MVELIYSLTWRAGVSQDCWINISYCQRSTSGQWTDFTTDMKSRSEWRNWSLHCPEEQVRMVELISSLPWRAGQNGGIDLFTALKSRSVRWKWSLRRSWVVELIPLLSWIAGQDHRIDSLTDLKSRSGRRVMRSESHAERSPSFSEPANNTLKCSHLSFRKIRVM